MIPWIDSPEQKFDKVQLEEILSAILQCPINVLVHCAQGKSRSAVICISFLALLEPSASISELVQKVKTQRRMADPNHGFVKQLVALHKEGFFQKLAISLQPRKKDFLL